tara:strand:+ start:180 stop:374 length:195 start_codon:yes stop_codon:yes gene_type:complete
MSYQRLQLSLVWPLFRGVLFMDKWEKLNQRLEEYDKEFGEQERQEREAQRVIIKQITDNIEEPI